MHIKALQRLGYLLGYTCGQTTLADALFEAMNRESLRLFRIPLKAARETKGFLSGNRWKVIVNADIEIDE